MRLADGLDDVATLEDLRKTHNLHSFTPSSPSGSLGLGECTDVEVEAKDESVREGDNEER